AVIGHLAPALVVFVSAVILTTFCLKWLILATIGFLYASSSVPRSVARAHLGTLCRDFQRLEKSLFLVWRTSYSGLSSWTLCDSGRRYKWLDIRHLPKH